MKHLLVAATVLGMALPGVALAQSSNSSGSQNASQQSASSASQSGNKLATAQKVRQDLEKAGFSDVKVVAESFVIQAKSKDGDPIVMTVGPHGMTAFEAVVSDNAKTTGSTGSGSSGSGSQGGSAGSTPQK